MKHPDLTTIEYEENKDQPRHWRLKTTTLDQINLIAGVNASGKSRFLSIITALANLISGRSKALYSGGWKITLESEGITIRFNLVIANSHVESESLLVNDKKIIERSTSGRGVIFGPGGKTRQRFQIQKDQIATVMKRDSIQNPEVEYIHEWANSVRHYSFGSSLGKELLLLSPSAPDAGIQKTASDTSSFSDEKHELIALVERGLKKFPREFKSYIIRDFRDLGYKIRDIFVGRLEPGSFNESEIRPLALFVKEADLRADTPNIFMSNGMYRALYIIVRMNFFKLSKKKVCILVDDIGEGLDFDRSARLARKLIEKSEEAGHQLIMTTNDRFVMNAVPLKYWSILRREGHVVDLINARTNKVAFDRFQEFGLSNFDFFARGLFQMRRK
jgi:energy-coupling factor transporter ATP-binding protein EcfA2